VDCCYSELAI